MNINIQCMFTYEIFPHSSISFGHFNNVNILLENRGTLEIVSNNERVKIGTGIVLGDSSIKLVNCSEGIPVKLRGIVFSNLNRTILSPQKIATLKDEYQLQIARRVLYSNESLQNLRHTYKDLSALLTLNYPQNSLENFIDSRLIKINRHIRKNYAEPLTLDSLAEMIGCTPVYLSNTYSRVFNTPPIRHLQIIRMKKARQLLTETDLAIKEIARSLGYVSSSQFSMIFKRYYSCTPMEFKLTNPFKSMMDDYKRLN